MPLAGNTVWKCGEDLDCEPAGAYSYESAVKNYEILS